MTLNLLLTSAALSVYLTSVGRGGLAEEIEMTNRPTKGALIGYTRNDRAMALAA
jgi:hypothetical protein